ncbi:MAG: PQQ-binding-like beta-propeller repeat protein [Nitrososphaerales archaeon]
MVARTKIVTVLTVLLIGLVSISYQEASSQENLAVANWGMLYADQNGTNFSPQTQITRQTAFPLEIKWIYPLPKAEENPNVLVVAEGVEHSPLILDGIVYFVRGDETIFALNANDGRLVWTVEIPFEPTGKAIATSLLHTHGLQIFDETIYYLSKDCTAYGLDTLTAEILLRISDICEDIEGNDGYYSPSFPPTILRKEGVMIVSPAGGANAPRGFVAAYDLETHDLLWRWFVIPPSGGVLDWASEAEGKGNVRPVQNDWGSSRLFGGGGIWTRFAVDEELGRIFFGTGNPAPLFNATLRPGPNLYTSSIVSLDALTGELIWFYQTTPHDLGDFDCAWNTMLADVPIEGISRTVVIQGCKNGYLYVLDADNGEPVWDPLELPGIARVNDLNANMGEAGDFLASYGAPPRLWEDGFYLQCPSLTGAIETPNAFAYNTIFVGAKSDCVLISPGSVDDRPPPYIPFAGADEIRGAPVASNSTVFAIDASTGRIKWKYFLENSIISGGCCTVSGEVVYFGDVRGRLYALDAIDGRLLWVRMMGAVLSAPPSIGSSANGEMMLLIPVSGGPSAVVPGAILALGLPESEIVEGLGTDSLVLISTILAVLAVSSLVYAIWLKSRTRR